MIINKFWRKGKQNSDGGMRALRSTVIRHGIITAASSHTLSSLPARRLFAPEVEASCEFYQKDMDKWTKYYSPLNSLEHAAAKRTIDAFIKHTRRQQLTT